MVTAIITSTSSINYFSRAQRNNSVKVTVAKSEHRCGVQEKKVGVSALRIAVKNVKVSISEAVWLFPAVRSPRPPFQ